MTRPHRHEVVSHQAGVSARHEIHVSRPAGGDHRLSQQHCLKEIEPQPFRAVQRDVGIARRCQREHVDVGELPVDHERARGGGNLGQQGSRIGPRQPGAGVAEFDDQSYVGVLRECLPERRQDRLRIFAIEIAGDVEAEKKQRRVRGEAEGGSAGSHAIRQKHRLWIVDSRNSRERRRNSIQNEAAGREHEIHSGHRLPPPWHNGQQRQFPKWHNGVGALLHVEPGRPLEPQRQNLGWIELPQIHPMGGDRRGEQEVCEGGIGSLPPQSRIDVDCGTGPLASLKNRERIPCRHTEPHVAGDVPDQVHARRSGGAGGSGSVA